MHQRGWLALPLLVLLACGGSASMASPEAPGRSYDSGEAAPMAPPAEPASMDVMSKEEGSGSMGGDERMERQSSMTAQVGAQQPGGPPPPPPAGTPAVKAGGKGEQTAGAVQVQSPMLIYTAQLSMAVFEVSPSLAQIQDLARELGGFLAKRDDMAITIRVPSQRFDEAIRRIEKIGDVLHRNVTAEDVTEEFRDLEVRLRHARAIRERLEQLLAKAAKVEESILIERELGRVAGEIERIEGRMKFLRDRAAFSTITVNFQARQSENVSSKKPQLPVPWLYEMGLGRLLNL